MTHKQNQEFKFIGTTRENHRKIVSLGHLIGCQDVRKMTIGDKIAELANTGNNRAIKVCTENPELFPRH